MKKQINDLLLKMQNGENCIGETANQLMDLFDVSSSVCHCDKLPIRVKALDADDIIEAGWRENENQSSSYLADYLLGDDWVLDIFDSEMGIRIMYRNEIRFFGIIKNYNELLKVMKMLNIKTQFCETEIRYR